MIVTCKECGWTFDDAYRWTICPHDTFAANDGHNNFAHHVESLLKPPPWDGDRRPRECVRCHQQFALAPDDPSFRNVCGNCNRVQAVPACKFCTDPRYMARRPVIRQGDGGEFAGVVWLHPTVGEGRSVECESQSDLVPASSAIGGPAVYSLSTHKQPRVRNWYGVRCVLFWWDKLRGRHRGTAQAGQWFPKYI